MDAWRTGTRELEAWIAGLIGDGRRVVAPAADGGPAAFRAVNEAGEVRLDEDALTRLSPKEWVFPRSETLLTFRGDGAGVTVEPMPADATDQVLLGVRPCDAAGLCRLDDVFLAGEADELYAARRAATTVVSVACARPRPACFCTAVGGSPSGTEGSDLQLVRLDGDAWLVRCLTARGRELAGPAAERWSGATEADERRAAELAETASAAVACAPLPAGVPEALAGAFAGPVWDELARRCLGCGVCAAVCPSCSCFDISDAGGAVCGTRCRSWDTCTLAGFTRHASGHNPRASQTARYRQRVLHKFSWFPLEHGRLMCVGCGRCGEQCPVGIDMHAAVVRALGVPA